MELLRIYINVTATYQVQSQKQMSQMVLFEGECKSNYFTGKVLPGGVDTQMYQPDGSGTLSARYILRGVDDAGQECSIFIENQAVVGDKDGLTHPTLFTNSKSLAWMEDANLYGKITNEEDQLVILICSDIEE